MIEIIGVGARFIILLIFFVLSTIFSHAAHSAGNEVMRFEATGSGGNCDGCQWISASGTITANSVARFEKVLMERAEKYYNGKPFCGLVALDSNGGNLVGGLKLGWALRKYDCVTIVAGTAPEPADASVDALVPGECHSACAYAFLGGKQRRVLDGSRYGVHQHYRADAVLDSDEKVLSAIDMSKSQVLTGMIVAYVIEMGADPKLVWAASLVPPNSDIRVLNREMLERWKVVTDIQPSLESWILQPLGKGLVAQVTQIQDDFGESHRARLLCESQNTSHRLMEFIVPVTSQQEPALRDVLKGPQPPLILRTDKSGPITVDAFTSSFVGPTRNRFLIFRFEINAHVLDELRRGKVLRWERDPARWTWGQFRGYFSLRGSSVAIPFAFDHCL